MSTLHTQGAPHALPRLTLVAPTGSQLPAPAPSPDQQAVIGLAPGSGPVLIWGAPGTGKSTVLVEAAVKRMEHDGVDPAGALLLAPSRLAAARLRNAFSARLTRSLSTSPARTWSSYAFDLLRRAKVEGRMPYVDGPPRLMSGPEQDLIIKDLLAGHRMGLGRLPGWPPDLAGALDTRGFRQEVRQLFDRVIEYDVTPDQLAELGRENARPDWVAAASLYQEYRDVVDWGKSGSFDPAGIITAAATLLRNDAEFLEAERARLQLVLVDDIQEANRSVHELLALVGGGKEILVTASPDTVVQGFRGARPDLVGTLRESLAGDGVPVAEFTLSTSHRLTPELAKAWTGVVDRISQSRGGHRARVLAWTASAPEPGPAPEPRPAPEPGEGTAAGPPPSCVTAHLVASEVHELRLVAERILHLQHLAGHSLSEIAVIVRTGSALAELQRYLSGLGIPVKVPVAENPVRDEPAVRPLLEAFRVALDPSVLDAELAVSLLTSRLGRSTALHLRRLRQSLRQQELHSGGGRASDELLVEALGNPEKLAPLGWEAQNAGRIAAMLAAGRNAVAEPGANAETVLWALWDASDCSGTWESQALRGGPTGIRADRDLDAVMALFQTAERYVDQLPGSSPQQFLDYLLNQELPMDTLAARAQRSDAVEILTPASAAGREWPVVIVAGLQEGVWPNTRLRGEMLGSQFLVDVLERGPAVAAQVDPAARLREIRYDELRSFAAAISRAGRQLILTAATGHDLQPSQFLDLAAPYLPVTDSGGESQYPVRPVEQVPRPMTLRSLVAELRQESEMHAEPESARILAMLASENVPGASPSDWWGLLPLSSQAPIVADGEPVTVSPSKVEAVLKSPLNWFVKAAGGEATTDFARSLGTLIHSIAEHIPEGAGHEYLAELEKRWPSLGMGDSWEADADYGRAQEMLRKLAQYVVDARQQGRRLMGVEVDFSVDIPGGERVARLRGQVDRLEADADGNLVVIDLKTGKTKPTGAEIEHHPQLGSYQAAVLAGAFADVAASAGIVSTHAGGAALLPLGDGTKSVKTQDQAALAAGPDDWATPKVLEAALLMARATFPARHGADWTERSGCPLPSICPLCHEGKQVTE
ncbi:superfamily I DNA/RNA helicase/RecB family exonuclease [Arthrobacter silviterrae]|uniref:DNA 3'-5' helicase n=1 Tax=Arthrobacter silviterrae TaxID=2026658 RepID=A0ABX0DAP2_9MICC|nr:ATP-dependent DNA helicase [Arthrobacter silviterrae]MDQ0277184.1 superfamily I DNA/RNA helicase/RecB family exonuclease [Arthrobacter silviterrae]NGN83738.1 ATP-dependent helicase [Arthrobacter silviterrae]